MRHSEPNVIDLSAESETGFGKESETSFANDNYSVRSAIWSYDMWKNEAIHRASPVHSQQQYIATGLALCKNIHSLAIHRASPVYSQMGYIGVYSWWTYFCTGLALRKNIRSPAIHRASPVCSQMRYIGTGLTHSTDSTTLLFKLLVQSN